YLVPDTCNHSGCDEEINRGVYYTCGEGSRQSNHLLGGFEACRGFFCGDHLYMCMPGAGYTCGDCCASAEAAFLENLTPEEVAFLEEWEQALIDDMLQEVSHED